MKRKYNLFLKDIVGSIENIQEYIGTLDVEDLKENRLVIDAVVRNFQIIGEAVKNIPSSVKEKYPEVPWVQVADFRNKIVHQYWVVDIEILWDIVQHKLDILDSQINRILEKENS